MTSARRRRPAMLLFIAVSVLALVAGCRDTNNTPHRDGTAVATTPTSASTTSSAAGTVAASPGGPRRLLEELTVAARGPLTGYSRDKFPHWATVNGTCNTREWVLKHAGGPNVRVRRDCYPVAGSWTSPYDGATWTKPSDVDIDHVVPLANAWVSGATSWTPERREQFANDRTRPQLKVVTDNVNEAKGDKAPDQWRPPLGSNWCEYATDWITVKHFYQLTITSAEKLALAEMLRHCGGSRG